MGDHTFAHKHTALLWERGAANNMLAREGVFLCELCDLCGKKILNQTYNSEVPAN